MIVFPQALILSAAAAGEPLTKPRICYQVHSRDRGLGASAVTVSSETEEGPRDAPLSHETAEYWLPSALPATWQLDFGAALDVDYVGVAGHTLGSEACSLKVETSTDGVDWEQFADEVLPADDTPILFLDDSRSVRYIRLTLAGTGDPARIAVVYAGEALAMPETVESPFTPITMARETVLKAQVTRGGQFLAQSVRRHGVSSEARFRNLTASFMRSQFDPFIRSARQFPFFFAWCAQFYPTEVGYCWATKDIRPGYQGMADYMEVKFAMDGIGAA